MKYDSESLNLKSEIFNSVIIYFVSKKTENVIIVFDIKLLS